MYRPVIIGFHLLRMADCVEKVRDGARQDRWVENCSVREPIANPDSAEWVALGTGFARQCLLRRVADFFNSIGAERPLPYLRAGSGPVCLSGPVPARHVSCLDPQRTVKLP
jgi:hypothetical protein